ncbi:S-formylglutathione hydrolase [Mariprofundus ferrooxydans]|uniref:S-formylglutathione hydrolase n=1 Tax=Mariprofundus ferrooxydans TaxID=314344 RepID=UPI0003773D2F|nr:S-formylglutathione hydrolase [Mariprofundus ferrooxydans]
MRLLKSHKCCGGHVHFYEHDSYVTKTAMKFSVFIPESSQPLSGCLIWLSGLTCNEENFITKAGAIPYLAERNMMVICPDTSPRGLDLPGEHDSWDFGSGAGFYLSAQTDGYKEHYNMYDYINEEIYDILLNEFSVNRRQISLCGHSMGGHGALVIGLKNPDKYKRISAFSPVVNPLQCPWGQKAFSGYLGDENQASWSAWDATELVRAGHKHPSTILIEQGRADDFLGEQLLTDHFQQACNSSGQAVEIRYHDGYDHSYYFISTFIKEHI